MGMLVSFDTDENGEMKQKGKLYENATYERVPPRKYVRDRLRDREAVAAWVRNAVVGDLETLDQGIALRTDTTKGGGNFLLLIGCMMAVEYFATIFDGVSKQPAERAIAFAREFMANHRYATCMRLLMRHARNGIAHGSWPARVRVNGTEYPFAIGYESEYPTCVHLHLSFNKAEHEAAATEVLFVNPRVMLADLRDSVEREPGGFRRWILDRADDDAVTRAQPSLIDWRETDLSEWK